MNMIAGWRLCLTLLSGRSPRGCDPLFATGAARCAHACETRLVARGASRVSTCALKLRSREPSTCSFYSAGNNAPRSVIYQGAVSALVPTALFFLVLYALVFLSFLIREPFVDHRKVVWERDFREHQVRSVHLRHQAHDWLNGIQNEQRNVSPRGIKTNPNYFDARRVRGMAEYLERIRENLRRWGQPELADQVPDFSFDQLLDIEDYRRELDCCHRLFGTCQRK